VRELTGLVQPLTGRAGCGQITLMRMLALVSTAQLAAGLIGRRVALRTGAAYDTPFMKGSSTQIERDQWLMGTSFSAPNVMLATQAAAIAALATRRRVIAATTLGVLGALQFPGFLIEREVRESWAHPSWERTPLTVSGAALAVAMAVLGLGYLARARSTATS
jgi:hypothetical protein